MEFVLAASVIGIGYAFNNKGVDRNDMVESDFVATVPVNNKPNGNNIYENKTTINIRKDEQARADRLFAKSKNSLATNVMIAGPPMPIFNKVDYVNEQLPIEYNEGSPEFVLTDKENNNFNGMSLTGEPITVENFSHNNMSPFFGGSVKQNVDENCNKEMFENHTGTCDVYQKKKEVGTFFKPKMNVSNPYGAGNLDGYMNDRYIVGQKRDNVGPTPQIQVGPGLNKGFTSEPSGGFQQSDTRDYAMPKTTNELRVQTDPKISYKARIISGMKNAKPGKVGAMEKNRPETYYKNTPDRYLTTTGAVMASKQRPNIVMKHVNRPKTEQEKRIGPAGPATGGNMKLRSKIKESNRIQLSGPGYGGANAAGEWDKDKHDYGKRATRVRNTVRQKTGNSKRVGIAEATQSQGDKYRNNQKLRKTRKTNVVGNGRWAGNAYGSKNKGQAYDPNDIARVTIKQTNIHDNRTGNMNSGAPKGATYDPNDIARVTIKETNIHDTRTGNMNSGATKGATYDPNDIARVTIKETNIHDNRTGNMNSGATKGATYDPNDIAKTTIKETNIHDNRTGNMGTFKKPTQYDPNDIARVTTKETAIMLDHMGNYGGQDQKGTGYQIKEMEAQPTNRQTTSTEYVNNPEFKGDGGYKVVEVNAPNTNRQFTSDIEYQGGAGGGEVKPVSYADVYNSTIKSIREDVAVGRIPAAAGPQQSLGSDGVSMTTNKMGDMQNKHITDRGVMSTKVYNSIPQPVICSRTKEKETVPNLPISNRLDPGILDQFKKNPYTKPLDSYFYN
jgi:hypothetical protein